MDPPGAADRVGVARRRSKAHLALICVVVAVVAALGVGAAAIWAALEHKGPLPSVCRVTADSSEYSIDLEQAASATTITVVAKRLGLPDHAVTIALAAALQESQLHNIAYGDRDSLGLFQQRPSEGWGTPKQILNPSYAAAAFFKALERVPGWQTMAVTDAAQAVQHSDAPNAYAVWEPLARTLAIATTGEVPSGLACQFSVGSSVTAAASPVPALTAELGSTNLGSVSGRRGWIVASWLVGHAHEYGITTVRFAGRQWTSNGAWTPARATGPGIQIVQSASARA